MKPRRVSLVSAQDLRKTRQRIDRILSRKYIALDTDLLPMVEHLMEKRERILDLAKRHRKPFYIIDKKELENSIELFSDAFNTFLPDSEFYYAMKVNHHPYIIKTALRRGFGVDVSSEKELRTALKLGAKKIVFSGPAKSIKSLELAVENNARVTINIDSFRELENLAKVTKRKKRSIRAGVRISGQYARKWSKFGIPMNELRNFWDDAQKYPLIQLEGIHIHLSWNKNSRTYAKIFLEISRYLRKNFKPAERRDILFFDFGGGYRPYLSEGYYPWHTPQGRIIKLANDYNNEKVKFNHRHFIVESVPIAEYAEGIGAAIDKYIRPVLPNARYYTEPGRAICNNAMHVVIKIADIKSNNVIIADGGTNMIGWERFEYDYFPLINLTHPSTEEIECLIYGSLCMPEDIWGYYCYASGIAEGDVILVPYQGAITYSLAQEFIHGFPDVFIMK